MIEITHVETFGFEAAIRGMRMPYESFDKSDSYECDGYDDYHCYVCKYANRDFDRCERPYSFTFGSNDMALAKKLIKAGPEHRKFLRMIHVQAEVRAPRFWWAEMDKYKWVEANSSSTMHLITKRELTLDDFSNEFGFLSSYYQSIIDMINKDIRWYNHPEIGESDKREVFYRIKHLLPEGFMQLRMIDLNYECLLNIYRQRHNHRLLDWKDFCKWVKSLPYMADFLEVGDGD